MQKERRLDFTQEHQLEAKQNEKKRGTKKSTGERVMNIVAVSYTHLDVYKRQLIYLEKSVKHHKNIHHSASTLRQWPKQIYRN